MTIRFAGPGRALFLASSLALSGACTTIDNSLEVEAPQVILPEDAAGATGASALRSGVRRRMQQSATGNESTWLMGGMLTDEYRNGDTFTQRIGLDSRQVTADNNSFLYAGYRDLNRVRVEAFAAIAALRPVVGTNTAPVGEMFTAIAYSFVQLAETFCDPMPISTLDGTTPVYGGTISRDSLLRLAVAYTDSALANVGGTEGAAVSNFARVIRGRALLNLNQPAQAATAVAGVPTTFRFNSTHSNVTGDNQHWALGISRGGYIMGTGEGTNGINFDVGDPRVRVVGRSSSQDQFWIPARVANNWDRFSPTTIAGGIEARLIEAEASLAAGNAAAWLTALNALRASTANYPCPAHITGCTVTALPALADPGTDPARVDLHFRERAFWLYGTGHRLGDLRRLVRNYGRAANSVYPTGDWRPATPYGTSFVLPVPIEELNNPQYVGQSCPNLNP